MGMFDCVEFEITPAEIPDIKEPWQTKDLECFLNQAKVTASGRLLYSTWSLNLDDGWENRKTIWSEWVDLDYHGDIFIIGGAPPFDEFRLRFTNGKLESIQKLPIDTAA